MPLFLLLLIIPLIEIALFVTVGDWLGLPATLAIVICTAILGTWMLRREGRATVRRLQTLTRPEEASTALIDGVFLFAAALLLITPGYFTDAVGLAFIFPPTRAFLAKRLSGRVVQVAMSGGVSGGQRSGAAPGMGSRWDENDRNTAARPGPRPHRPVNSTDAAGANRDVDDAVVLDAEPKRSQDGD